MSFRQGALKKNSIKEAATTNNAGPKKKGPKKKMTLATSGKVSLNPLSVSPSCESVP